MNAELDNKLQMSEFLLQIKAIKLNDEKPFTWASGWKSPIYCDNRKTLSYPKCDVRAWTISFVYRLIPVGLFDNNRASINTFFI